MTPTNETLADDLVNNQDLIEFANGVERAATRIDEFLVEESNQQPKRVEQS